MITAKAKKTMPGKTTRSKVKIGERAAKALLVDYDYTIIADTKSGLSTGDLVVKSPDGTIYDVEVKNRRMINVPMFLGQARKNAGRSNLAWMVMCKIETTSSWLVLRKGKKPTTWHEK